MAGDSTRIELADEAATLALGRRLAGLVAPGDVVALHGELGAGKTTLARGLIAGLAARAGLPPEEVPSPSFALVQVYELAGLSLWHFDLYRIRGPEELEELGWDEALTDGVLLVEWPERAGRFLPAVRLDIHLVWSGAGRRADISGGLATASLAQLEPA